MRDHFLQLFQYNAWANKKISEAVSELPNTSEYLIKIMNHINAAQEIWLNRIINPEASNMDVFPNHDIKDCIEALSESSNEWYLFIESMMDEHLQEVHYYNNSKGDSYQNTLEEIAFHVINHSNYHRGQVNREIRVLGGEPPKLDYIFYSRDEMKEAGLDLE